MVPCSHHEQCLTQTKFLIIWNLQIHALLLAFPPGNQIEFKKHHEILYINIGGIYSEELRLLCTEWRWVYHLQNFGANCEVGIVNKDYYYSFVHSLTVLLYFFHKKVYNSCFYMDRSVRGRDAKRLATRAGKMAPS